MAYETQVQSGVFTSTGATTYIDLRFDPDWMEVYNYTVLSAGGAATTVESFWQRGMADGAGIQYTKLAADNSTTIGAYAGLGFTRLAANDAIYGAPIVTTGITADAPPRVTLVNTTGLANGDVVHMGATAGALQVGGMDFTIGNLVANTRFELTNMATIAAAAVAGTVRRVRTTHPSFYPSKRYITAITQAAQAVVTVSVNHTFQIGQEIRMTVPAAFGMIQMDGLTGTITAVTAGTFTLDINSAAFTAFVFPLTAATPFTPAMAIPYGTDAAYPNELDPSVRDTGSVVMQLGATNVGVVGVNTNVIYWRAGRSYVNTDAR